MTSMTRTTPLFFILTLCALLAVACGDDSDSGGDTGGNNSNNSGGDDGGDDSLDFSRAGTPAANMLPIAGEVHWNNTCSLSDSECTVAETNTESAPETSNCTEDELFSSAPHCQLIHDTYPLAMADQPQSTLDAIMGADQLGITFNILQTHSPTDEPEYFSNFRFDACVFHNDVELKCKEFASWKPGFEAGGYEFKLPKALELTADSTLTLTFSGEHWATCPAAPGSPTGSVQMSFNPVDLGY